MYKRTKIENRRSKIEKDLIRYAKEVVQAGFVIGTGGNISVRDADIVYLTARDADLSCAKATDFVEYNLNTDRLVSKKLPTHELQLHLGCFRNRPDIRAVIHVHPPLVLALPSNISRIRPSFYELKTVVETDIPVIKALPAATHRLANTVAKKIKDYNALILKEHGIVTVGRTLQQAFIRAQALERMALVLILRRIQGI